MAEEKLNKKLSKLLDSPDFPEFDPRALANTLRSELDLHWKCLPKTTRAAMLAVVASLERKAASDFLG